MMMQSLQKTRRVYYHLHHFWSRFGSGQTVYTYRCNRCQQISQMNADFAEIILSFPQDRSQISLNKLIHPDFGVEKLDNKLCPNCNNSDTSEVTTSIHTHPNILIIMLKCHEYINNEPGRVNTRVNFPTNEFVPNQGLENVETTMEYNLFAAICHKESRDKTSGHYTAQCKIKDSNNHWIKYNNVDLESNNFINQRNRTKARVKYHPLAYFLFYIKRDPTVLPDIGLQVQDNNGVSQLLADAHDDEQHHGDLITNKQQDVSVREGINQVNGTNVCNQRVPGEINRIINVDQSSADNNANVNPRVQQTNRTVINVDPPLHKCYRVQQDQEQDFYHWSLYTAQQQ
jgi:hypothetical protein